MPGKSNASRAPTRRRDVPSWLVVACLASVTACVFGRAFGLNFVTWDDTTNFVSNQNYRGLGFSQLSWMWTTFHLGHYTPLSWMTLGLDYELWGMNPSGYHATSVILHAVNSALLYQLFLQLLIRARMGAAQVDEPRNELRGLAAGGALLFAIHPLRVESVAWVTERRDVVSLLLLVVSILLYLRSTADPAARSRYYWCSVIAFAAALLSKATVMTLPAVLLVLNIYPLRRLHGVRDAKSRRVLIEIIPFGVLASGFALLSIVALHPPAQLSVAQKLGVSAYGLAFYVRKTLLPTGLSPLYELPGDIRLTEPRVLEGIGVVLVISALAVVFRRRWPALAAAWAIFFVVTLPMLGVVQNGPQIAADRYTYHSGASLALLVSSSWLAVAPRWRRVVVGIGAVLLCVLGVLTWQQTAIWHDGGTLWERAVEIDDRSPIALNSLAGILYERNDVDQALALSRRAAALAPTYEPAFNNVGIGLARSGDNAGARAAYEHALTLKPDYDEAESNLGVIAARQGDTASAILHYHRAIADNPMNADAHVNLGNVLARQHRLDEAIGHFESALTIRPDHADAQFDWGVALANAAQLRQAAVHFRAALAIDSNHVEAREFLARAERVQR